MTLSIRIALWAGLTILISSVAALIAVSASGAALPWQFRLPAVSLHVGLGLAALGLGATQVLLAKRGRRHRWAGYLWCGLLAVVALSGLAVRLDPGEVTPIHRISSLFSVATLALLPVVIQAGQTGQRRTHRNAILAIYALLITAGGLTFLPHRAIGGLFVTLAQHSTGP